MGEISSKPTIDSNDLKLNLITGKKRTEIEQKKLINRNKKLKIEIVKLLENNDEITAQFKAKEILENQSIILKYEILKHITDIIMQYVKNKQFDNLEEFQNIEKLSKLHAFLYCTERTEIKEFRIFMKSISDSFGYESVDSAITNSDGIIDSIIIKTQAEEDVTQNEVDELIAKFKKVDEDIFSKWKDEQIKSDKQTLKQSSLMVQNQNIKTEDSGYCDNNYGQENEMGNQNNNKYQNNFNQSLEDNSLHMQSVAYNENNQYSHYNNLSENVSNKIIQKENSIKIEQKDDISINIANQEIKHEPEIKSEIKPQEQIKPQAVVKTEIFKNEPEKEVKPKPEIITEIKHNSIEICESNSKDKKTNLNKMSLSNLADPNKDEFLLDIDSKLENLKKDEFIDDLESRLNNLKIF